MPNGPSRAGTAKIWVGHHDGSIRKLLVGMWYAFGATGNGVFGPIRRFPEAAHTRSIAPPPAHAGLGQTHHSRSQPLAGLGAAKRAPRTPLLGAPERAKQDGNEKRKRGD